MSNDMTNMEEAFSEFIQFCKPYLNKLKSAEILNLLERRFNDCSTEFKSSTEILDLIQITTAKIDSDSHNIFIYIRDFHNELKLHKVKKKRKRDSEDECVENEASVKVKVQKVKDLTSVKHNGNDFMEIEDSESVHNVEDITKAKKCEDDFVGNRAPDKVQKLNKGGNSEKRVPSEASDEVDCIMIEDSDNENDDFNDEKNSPCSETLHVDSDNLQHSKKMLQSANSISFENSKNNSPRASNSGKNKLTLNKISKPQESLLHGSIGECSCPVSNSGITVNGVKSQSKPDANKLQLKLTPQNQKNSQVKSVISINDPIVLDDDSDENEEVDENDRKHNLEKRVGSPLIVTLEERKESSDLVSSETKTSGPKNESAVVVEKEISSKVDNDDTNFGNVLRNGPKNVVILSDIGVEDTVDKEESSQDFFTGCSEKNEAMAITSEQSKTEGSMSDSTNRNNCHDDTAKKTATTSGVLKTKSSVSELTNENACYDTMEKEAATTSGVTKTKGISELTNKNACHDEIQNVEGGTTSAAGGDSMDKENENKGDNSTTGGENKTKTGSKKQIARLEKLLEDLRNKIEELQEKEVGLDEMDDDCSTYILQDKYERKFVKVWDKLCELKKLSNSTGRPSERRFTFTGTRYPEINRKLEKFVNKRKIFPDFHDVKAVIVKVNKDKKIGLRASDIDRLSREAFLDIGENLQDRRRKDLVTTSAGHLKGVEKLPEDPALHDAELKKKLSMNKKFYREKMDKVLSKYSEIADNVEEEETDDSAGTEEDEEELVRGHNDEEVPELTTILEGRGSPELENLDSKAKEEQLCLENESFEQRSFIIETDNAESSSFKECSMESSLLTSEMTSGDERMFQRKNNFILGREGRGMQGSGTSDFTSEDERFTKGRNKSENVQGSETDYSLMSGEKTSGDEGACNLYQNDLSNVCEEIIEDKEINLIHSDHNDVNACSTPLGFSGKKTQLASNVVNVSEPSQDIQSAESTVSVSAKQCGTNENNDNCPKLYIAEKCDDTDPDVYNKCNKSLPMQTSRHQFSGDDDLFGSSENDSRSNTPILNIIERLDIECDENVQPACNKTTGSHSPANCNDVLTENMGDKDNEEKKCAFNQTKYEKLCSSFLSASAKSRAKNLLHLKKPDTATNENKDNSATSHRLGEDTNDQIKNDQNNQKETDCLSLSDSSNSCSENMKIKKIKLTSDIRERACKLLTPKGGNTSSKMDSVDTEPDNENSVDDLKAREALLDSALREFLSKSSCKDENLEASNEGQRSASKKARSLSPLPNSNLDTSCKGQRSNFERARSRSPLLNSPASQGSEPIRDSEDIITLSLGDTTDDGGSQKSKCSREGSQTWDITQCDSQKEGEMHNSKSSRKSSSTSPFMKIVDVTSIDLEEYNSDSFDTPKKNSEDDCKSQINGGSGSESGKSKNDSVKFAKKNLTSLLENQVDLHVDDVVKHSKISEADKLDSQIDLDEDATDLSKGDCTKMLMENSTMEKEYEIDSDNDVQEISKKDNDKAFMRKSKGCLEPECHVDLCEDVTGTSKSKDNKISMKKSTVEKVCQIDSDSDEPKTSKNNHNKTSVKNSIGEMECQIDSEEDLQESSNSSSEKLENRPESPMDSDSCVPQASKNNHNIMFIKQTTSVLDCQTDSDEDVQETSRSSFERLKNRLESPIDLDEDDMPKNPTSDYAKTSKKKLTDVLECQIDKDEVEVASNTSNFSKRFGRMNKIAQHLSSSKNCSKGDNHRTKQRHKDVGLINLDGESKDVIILSDSD